MKISWYNKCSLQGVPLKLPPRADTTVGANTSEGADTSVGANTSVGAKTSVGANRSVRAETSVGA